LLFIGSTVDFISLYNLLNGAVIYAVVVRNEAFILVKDLVCINDVETIAMGDGFVRLSFSLGGVVSLSGDRLGDTAVRSCNLIVDRQVLRVRKHRSICLNLLTQASKLLIHTFLLKLIHSLMV